jgi:phage portal protein|nr:MAG TPA: portal protein [Caudoviricetes sp.]DAX94106.1 MAG TPA: portal protein [Caudoviricetes sp.]
MFKFFRKKEQGTTIKSFNDLLNYARAFNISPYTVNVQRMLKQIPENPFISSALERMQQGFYSIDWSVYEENTEGKNEKKDNIVYRSLINPNALMDTDDFLYYCYLYWAIFGEFLIQKIKLYNKYDLWIYSPAEYTINYNNNNILFGIQSIDLSNGKKISGKELENFCYKKMPNLYSKGNGINRVTSLALLHDYYCLISRWNNSILKNSGKRQFLILLDQLGTGETIEKIQDRISENSGADGIGKPIILSGFDEKSKIHNLDFTPRDFDFMEATAEIRNITSNVLNVPDLLIGGKDNAKYNNMQEAKKALYTENIIPAAEQIKSCINRLFQKDFGHNELIDFDTSKIEVLKDNKIELINTLNASEFHTINEKRKMLNLDSIAGADEILIKGMPSTLTDVLNGEVEPIDNNPSEDDI